MNFAAALADRLELRSQQARWREDPVAWVQERLGEHVWSKQAQIMRSVAENKLTSVQSCHGVGKALALDTPLPTPTGWTTMGEVRVGDDLLNEQGKPATVLAISPIEQRDTYQVSFDDGSVIIASDDHQWQVIDLCHRPRKIADWREHWAATVTRTTRELADNLRTDGGQLRWRVPTARPLAGNPTSLPVPPYTLGFWLGDGTSSQAAVVIGHEDAPHSLAALHAEGVGTRLRPSSVRAGCSSYGLLGVLDGLRSLDVFGNKHVPAAVLRADVETRLAVLQGLMDTDGFVSTGQSVGIDLCDKQLADGVAELVVSLGWKAYRSTKVAKLDGRVVGTVYRLQFRPDMPVFRLPRKADRLGKLVSQRSRHTQRTITAIEPIESVPVKCVAVDSPSRLYLAGRSMIPTHNTHLASRLVLWFLDTHPPQDTMVVTTAPTSHQVRAVLWRYIRQGHEAASMPGIITQSQVPEWKIDGNLVGYGRRPADHQRSAFQGQHAEHMLVVLDEAGGIPKWLWDAADSLMTGSDNHLLAIGNPDDNASHFHTVSTKEPGWARHHISAFDAPAFTGEQIPAEMALKLVQREWVEDKQVRWGESNPLYRAKVLGEWVDSEDALIPLSWVRAANQRWIAWDEAGRPPQPGRLVLGVDVARYGEDSTVIAHRHGDVITHLDRHDKLDTTQTTALVTAALYNQPKAIANVDVIGVGAGVVDQLRALGMPVAPFNAASGTRRRDATGSWQFPNVRSASYWNLRELLDPANDSQIALPPDDELTAELTIPKWDIRAGGRLVIEDKDSIRKRLGRSTDSADAVVQAFWQERTPDVDEQGAVKQPRVRRYADAVSWR
ncbi:LAGLIDADG family homing endonuclease [Saccharopolyspora sp. NPDC002376]